MSLTGQLLDGLGLMLDANGVGKYADVLSDPDWGVVIGPRVPQSPSRLIVLTPYMPGSDSSFMTDSTVNVQARFRGTNDPRDVNDKADQVFALWQDLARVSVGGVAVVHAARVSQTPNGADDNDRLELFQNWAWQIIWPTPNRTDN